MKHKLPSGTELLVTPLEWEESWEVCQQVLSVIEQLDVDIKGMTLEDLKAQDVLNFKNPICKVLASPLLFGASKKCLDKCTYGGVRVDKMTFSKPEARGDFLMACFYALKENCAPFFGSLLSALKVI